MKRRWVVTAHARTAQAQLIDEMHFYTRAGAVRYCNRIGNGHLFYWRVHDKDCLGHHLGDCAVSGLVRA